MSHDIVVPHQHFVPGSIRLENVKGLVRSARRETAAIGVPSRRVECEAPASHKVPAAAVDVPALNQVRVLLVGDQHLPRRVPVGRAGIDGRSVGLRSRSSVGVEKPRTIAAEHDEAVALLIPGNFANLAFVLDRCDAGRKAAAVRFPDDDRIVFRGRGDQAGLRMPFEIDDLMSVTSDSLRASSSALRNRTALPTSPVASHLPSALQSMSVK